jgi:hypothetical protein
VVRLFCSLRSIPRVARAHASFQKRHFLASKLQDISRFSIRKSNDSLSGVHAEAPI